MNRKQPLIILLFLLYLPVFAHAGVVYLKTHPNINHSEFASPVGVFNTNLGISFHGEFTTQGLLSGGSALSDVHTEELKSPGGIFGQSGNELKSSGSMFKNTRGEFKFSLPK